MSQFNLDHFEDQKTLRNDVGTKIIFDAGAQLGKIAQIYRRLFPEARVICFEPDPTVFGELRQLAENDGNMEAHNIAISDQSGTSDLQCNSLQATSSLLKTHPEAALHWGAGLCETRSVISVPTSTIDEFCKHNDIESIDILKMDIQGSELYALRGAEEMLHNKKIDFIYTEMLFVNTYERQSHYSEVFRHLSMHGYSLYNMYHLAPSASSGQLLQADCLFLPSDRSLALSLL